VAETATPAEAWPFNARVVATNPGRQQTSVELLAVGDQPMTLN
jgi:hypothetical protein